MLPITIAGTWAATQPTVASRRWVRTAPDLTAHYFLVVSHGPHGTTAFVRNPEANAGAFLGTRDVSLVGTQLRLKRRGRPDVAGALNADGTLTLNQVAIDGANVRFHRATARDLRWFYPAASSTWTYHKPAPLSDGWRVATFGDVGMRPGPIAPIMNAVLSQRSPALRSPYIQSVTIERHGRLVLDDYFYGFGPSLPHDVRSAGKSVTTLIVGRAIAETGMFSAASRVLPLLPQYRNVRNDDARKGRMTVANLMTMASGLACDDNDDASPGNEDTMQSRPSGTDWYRYTLDLPMKSEPGTRALYCSAGINLLGAIVRAQRHVALDRYFQNNFAAPMQFGTYAMWLMPPPANEAYMAGGDRFRPRDFLKFGALILNDGMWNGRRIVDADWIRQSIVPRTAPEGEGDRYGYGWHISTLAVGGHSYEVVNAGGNGGQLMIVVPALDLAIMVTAGNYQQFPVWRTFLPAITSAAIRSCLAQIPTARERP